MLCLVPDQSGGGRLSEAEVGGKDCKALAQQVGCYVSRKTGPRDDLQPHTHAVIGWRAGPGLTVPPVIGPRPARP